MENRNWKLENRNLEQIAWRSPSNIALVKYWGKKPLQIPANPSLSMTLKKAYTEMVMACEPVENNPGSPWIEFLFEGHKQEEFERKISDFFKFLSERFPLLADYRFKISSSNTFPHSTGIASSASSMSALGLCLAEFMVRKKGLSPEKELFMREASILSRLASGSACRSVYGGYVIWGKTLDLKNTSDEYAVPVPFEVHPEMRAMKDAILVVSSKEKEVSSRAGHSLMDGHPYAERRFDSAGKNTVALSHALVRGDFEEFVNIAESEALALHAMMMTSFPSFLLFEPNTINIVNRIRQFRKDTKIPVCFTLDAGPNVHMIYPASFQVRVKELINSELVQFCENGKWIDDEIGEGPESISMAH
jgi:diphosphomevalonate decarboxylase